MSDGSEAKIGCGGCLSFVLACIVLWGLLFGFTWNGKTHGVSCSCAKGVEVK